MRAAPVNPRVSGGAESIRIRAMSGLLVVAGGAARLEPRAVTRAIVREVLDRVLRLVTDLDAFALDYFHEVYRRWSAGMDRVARTSMLLALVPPEVILAALRAAYPKETAAALQSTRAKKTKQQGAPMLVVLIDPDDDQGLQDDALTSYVAGHIFDASSHEDFAGLAHDAATLADLPRLLDAETPAFVHIVTPTHLGAPGQPCIPAPMLAELFAAAGARPRAVVLSGWAAFDDIDALASQVDCVIALGERASARALATLYQELATGATVASAYAALDAQPARMLCRAGVEASRVVVIGDPLRARRVRRAVAAITIGLLLAGTAGTAWYLVRSSGELVEVEEVTPSGCRICINHVKVWSMCRSPVDRERMHLRPNGFRNAEIVGGCFDQIQSWDPYELSYDCEESVVYATGRCDKPNVVTRPRPETSAPAGPRRR
jgi:hypothetical protein